MAKYYLLSFLILWSGFNKATDNNNGFESIDETNSLPIWWSLQAPNYNTIKLDSITKYEGKYSLSIENAIDFNTQQEAMQFSPKEFEHLSSLKVNDKITVKSHSAGYSPNHLYLILSSDYIARDKNIIFKRDLSRKNGC